MRKLIYGAIGVVIVGAAAAVAFRYQPTVYLMPTPAVISQGAFNPFSLNPDLEKGGEVPVLFATNRAPAFDTEDRIYTIFPGDRLRFGVARMQIGGEETTWEKLVNLSTSADEGDRPPLRLKEMRELASYPLGGDPKIAPEAIRALADSVNGALERSVDKDVMIYVHGANTAKYRACAQAAQFRHFTGRNSVVMAFLWPSAENLLGYGTDTRHALKSAPAFALLLELLARHTDARNINILAYSAGAQILSPALDIIGRETAAEDRRSLRIGQAYFAAADISVQTFVKHLKSYIDIPRTTTVAMNRRDSVLALAAWRNRVSRAGSPDRADLSEEKNEWVRQASLDSRLSIIEVSAETVSGMRSRSHDFWYTHPWVSSDVLVQFLFHKAPRQRGLAETIRDDNLRYWTFPADYPERIADIVEQLDANIGSQK